MGYKLFWSDKKVEVYYGEASNDIELMTVVNTISGDPRFDDLRQILHDFSACRDVVYSTETIEQIAGINFAAALSNFYLKIALVGAPDKIARIVEVTNALKLSGFPMMAFENHGDATNWLADEVPSHQSLKRLKLTRALTK